jgi:hypothetical protein
MRPNRKLVYGKELAEFPNGRIRHNEAVTPVGWPPLAKTMTEAIQHRIAFSV